MKNSMYTSTSPRQCSLSTIDNYTLSDACTVRNPLFWHTQHKEDVSSLLLKDMITNKAMECSLASIAVFFIPLLVLSSLYLLPIHVRMRIIWQMRMRISAQTTPTCSQLGWQQLSLRLQRGRSALLRNRQMVRPSSKGYKLVAIESQDTKLLVSSLDGVAKSVACLKIGTNCGSNLVVRVIFSIR